MDTNFPARNRNAPLRKAETAVGNRSYEHVSRLDIYAEKQMIVNLIVGNRGRALVEETAGSVSVVYSDSYNGHHLFAT